MTSTAVALPLDSTVDDASEQLTLLPSTTVQPRFRLSKDTRERGLRHVAEIRQMIAERAAQQRGEFHHDRAA